MDIAWLDSLEPASRAALAWRPLDDDNPAPWRNRPLPASRRQVLSLQTLFQLAEYPSQLARGDVCLVARLDAELPGMRIEPAAAQQREATLLVAHLRLWGRRSGRARHEFADRAPARRRRNRHAGRTPATGTP